MTVPRGFARREWYDPLPRDEQGNILPDWDIHVTAHLVANQELQWDVANAGIWVLDDADPLDGWEVKTWYRADPKNIIWTSWVFGGVWEFSRGLHVLVRNVLGPGQATFRWLGTR